MKEFGLILLFLLFIVFCIWISCVTDNSNRNYINNWALKNNHKIESVEETWFDTGPFWIKDKHHRIYRVEIEDDRTFYFRVGTFWTEIKEY